MAVVVYFIRRAEQQGYRSLRRKLYVAWSNVKPIYFGQKPYRQAVHIVQHLAVIKEYISILEFISLLQHPQPVKRCIYIGYTPRRKVVKLPILKSTVLSTIYCPPRILPAKEWDLGNKPVFTRRQCFDNMAVK